jgi:hypothetical protein
MTNIISSSRNITGGNTAQSLSAIKEILFDLLSDSVKDTSNVTAQQNLGVQLSNAVKKEGVVIIQNQNVEVLNVIIPKVIQALRIIDSVNQLPDCGPVVIEHEPESFMDVETAYLEHMFKNNWKWDMVFATFKMAYVKHVVNHFETQKDAADHLGIQASYLSKLLKEKDDGN